LIFLRVSAFFVKSVLPIFIGFLLIWNGPNLPLYDKLEAIQVFCFLNGEFSIFGATT